MTETFRAHFRQLRHTDEIWPRRSASACKQPPFVSVADYRPTIDAQIGDRGGPNQLVARDWQVPVALGRTAAPPAHRDVKCIYLSLGH